MPTNWSQYQLDYFDALRYQQYSIQQNARAGSGKTHTAIAGAAQITDGARICFTAFGKANADDLRSKLPDNVVAATLNSIGNRAVRSVRRFVKLDQYKTQNIVRDMLQWKQYSRDESLMLQSGSAKVVSLVKGTLTDYQNREQLQSLVDRFGIDLNSYEWEILDLIPEIMNRSDAADVIDFDDQIYWPIMHNAPIDQFDYVFGDEDQDFNCMQMELIRRMLSSGGRFIGSGDRQQSLYGFRGADPAAVDTLVNQFSCIEMQLPITYRCPVSHVERVKRLVPDIEAAPGAKEGRILNMNVHQMLRDKLLVPGTLGVCRNNAPLASVAFRLMRDEVPVVVRGRDIGQSANSLIKKLSSSSETTTGEMLRKLSQYVSNELQRLSDANADDAKKQLVVDKAETIENLSEGCSTVGELIKRIDELFKDTSDKNVVSLSSVHRAKGLEAETVVIFSPELMPSKNAKLPWQIEQEHNCVYVAETRSKDTLILEEH